MHPAIADCSPVPILISTLSCPRFCAAMSEYGETKPDIKPETDQLTIKIKDQANHELSFKVKGSTKLDKIMNAYCQKQGIEVSLLALIGTCALLTLFFHFSSHVPLQSSQVRFMFDGDRLKGESTVEEAGFEDGDLIDVVQQQVGGFH